MFHLNVKCAAGTALLEKAAQLNSIKLPRTLAYIRIGVPVETSVEELKAEDLPGWDADEKTASPAVRRSMVRRMSIADIACAVAGSPRLRAKRPHQSAAPAVLASDDSDGGAESMPSEADHMRGFSHAFARCSRNRRSISLRASARAVRKCVRAISGRPERSSNSASAAA